MLKIYGYKWGALVLGLSLFVASLFLFESNTRDVLGRWSYTYVGVLSAATVGWIGLLLWTVRNARRGNGAGSPAGKLISIATLLWGVAYLMDAIDDHRTAAKIFNLNVFGSYQPVAIALDLATMALISFVILFFLARRIPARFQNLGLTIATIAVFLLLGEAVSRIKAIAFPSTQGFPTYSSSLWNRRFVKLNSLGYRDVEHEIAADGKRRVLLIGDSYAFGTGVRNVEDRFGELTAKRLSALTGDDWEQINAARRDTATTQHIEMLERMRDFEREIVVLLYVFNDIDYLSPVTPRSFLVGPGGFVQRYHPARLLFLNSFLYQELYVRFRKIRFSSGDQPARSPYEDADLLNRHLDDIQRFVTNARSSGAKVLIVPYDINVGSDPASLLQYQLFLKAAQDRQLPVCSLLDAFRGHDAETLRVNDLDGHPNPSSNAIAAGPGADCILAELTHEPQ
jgi:hypothetical protein